ncbi:MAG TPA: hypothetical protein VHC70_09155 [Phycisphaerales bacterium]|jgi:hypothetical protein|nr:hypothetical protein [Phycisphaerales bacterium]
MTPIALPLLDRIDIASPCSARWEDMRGDDRKRRCAQCNLDVHNIAALTRDEAEAVLQGLASGRVCAQFYRRPDGTILTADCPVGLVHIRRAARRAVMRVAALIGLGAAAGIAAGMTSRQTWGDRLRLRAMRPYSIVCEWIAPAAAPAPPSRCFVRGEVFIPPPKSSPAPASRPAGGS